MKPILVSCGVTLLAIAALKGNVPTVVPATATSGGFACRETPAGTDVRAVGRIEGASPEIEVRPRVRGRIVEVFVQPGQIVEAGQALLKLDDQLYRQEVAIAAAELDAAEARLQRLHNGDRDERKAELAALCRGKEAELALAGARLKRIRKLVVQDGIVCQETVEHVQSRVVVLAAESRAAKARLELSRAAPRAEEVRIAEARINAARARLEMARVRLGHAVLVASRRSEILDVEAMVGELTGPDAEQAPLVMADTSGTQVRAFVDQKNAVRVSEGMRARIVVEGQTDRRLQGRVARVCPRMEPKCLSSDDPAELFDVDTREVWIDLEATETPLIGLRVEVVLQEQPRSAANAEFAAATSLALQY